MRKHFFSTLILALLLAGSATLATAQMAEPHFELISPAEGSMLRAGQVVEIQWTMRLDKRVTDDPFGEMEFYMETGEGLYSRITPQLSLFHRKFMWTVPNITTSTARLVAYAGTEGGGDFYRFPQPGTFSIRGNRRLETLSLGTLPKVSAGEDMRISWDSHNFKGDAVYDVMVSYDRGGRFHKAGSTTDNYFILPIEPDFAGSITIQIISKAGNGKVSTLLTRDSTVTVGGGKRN